MTRKTIAHSLADLRIDLKDSGVLWSDPELTRCLERAVADYSRMVPREMSREITVDAVVTSEGFTTPTAEDTDYFVTTWDISAVSDGDTATLAARRPDVPRPVQVTVTDADTSITQLVIIVKGYDDDDKYIEEFFYLEGGLIQTGQLYFALVTEVEVDEIAGAGAGDEIIVGTGSENGVFVKLANKPIKFGSVSFTGHDKDTDFEMDYYGGRIAMKSGGDLSANTAYTIAEYTKSRIDIDLSTLIDDLIRVDRVEYPVGNVPQQFSKAEVWGTILTLTGSHVTQGEVSDAEHLVIKYYAPHSAPNDQSSGSYPSYLETTIQQAASAYALFIKALEWEHQAVTDFASARTAMGNLTAAHTLVTAALAKVIKYLENNTNDDAAAILKDVTDDAAALKTAIDAAQDAAGTALAKVITYLETNADPNNAQDILEDIDTDKADLRTAAKTASDAANAYLDEVDTTDLGQATVGAEGLLETGDGLINQLNDGENVPALYADYSRARVQIAQARTQAALGYFQQVGVMLSVLRSYIEESNAWRVIGETFISEAQALMGQVN
ncbi:hypothetical protein LCGC14_2325710, partial [marine sediment metagenome]